MRARIKEGWYPYGVGFIVDVQFLIKPDENSLYVIRDIISGDRKNLELCKKKLINTVIADKYLDFNYNNMKDTIKAFRVKIKDVHPNPSMRGLVVHVSLDQRMEFGDRYKIEHVENCSKTHYDNYYIMEEFLEFESEELISEPLEQLLNLNPNQILNKVSEKIENEHTRLYDSGARRDGDENKPYTHSIQPYVRLRFGYHMRMGARKYGDKNYLKGFPDESIIESGDRHWTNIMAGDMSEDNLSAMLFAVQLLMLNQEKRGIKPDNWFKK